MKGIFKKIVAIFLVLSMVMSVGAITAFASEVDKNTPDNLVEAVNTTLTDVSQLDTITTEDGRILYDVTPLVSTASSEIYLGSFTFTNVNVGAARRIDASQVRFIVDFKKADSQTTDIDLEISLRKLDYVDGLEVQYDRGTERLRADYCSLTSDGYHHGVTEWFTIPSYERGTMFCIYYDAMTQFGYTGTGAYRSASIRIWMEIF